MQLYKYHTPTREGLILQIGENFGEIAPLPGFSKETIGEALEETLRWISTGAKPELPSVRWGIECAHRQLHSVKIPLCALGVKKGFNTVKLKLGHLKVEEAVLFVKQYIGSFQIRLDCNRAWTLAQALAFASHFHPTDFAYLEEPVQSFEELIEFSKVSKFPVAIDESFHLDWTKIDTLKAIVVKPTVIGYIPEHPLVVLSSAHETGLGLVHIANRAKRAIPIGLDTYSPLDQILTQPIDCKEGLFSWQSSKNPVKTSSLRTICAL